MCNTVKGTTVKRVDIDKDYNKSVFGKLGRWSVEKKEKLESAPISAKKAAVTTYLQSLWLKNIFKRSVWKSAHTQSRAAFYNVVHQNLSAAVDETLRNLMLRSRYDKKGKQNYSRETMVDHFKRLTVLSKKLAKEDPDLTATQVLTHRLEASLRTLNRSEKYMLLCQFKKFSPGDLADIAKPLNDSERATLINVFGKIDEKMSNQITDFLDQHLQPPGLDKLGTGAMNTVYKGAYRLKNGENFRGVFKFETLVEDDASFHYSAAYPLGFQQDHPAYGLRNVMSSKLDSDLLKFGVIPRTELAYHKSKVGMVMEFAQGRQAGNVSNFRPIVPNGMYDKTLQKAFKTPNWRDASLETKTKMVENLNSLLKDDPKEFRIKDGKIELKMPRHLDVNYDSAGARRELTKLQLMDIIAGQADRHWGNFFLNFDEKGDVIGVTGIDNDLCFGGRYGLAHKMFLERDRGVNLKLPDLPAVIDTDMKRAIDGLHPDDLRKMLDGWLEPTEVNAAVSRLEELKAHIETAVNAADPIKNNDLARIEYDVRDIKHRYLGPTPPPPLLIEPDQWGANIVGEVLDDANSYSALFQYRLGRLKPDFKIDLTQTS